MGLFDSKSPHQHTCSSQENETKLIVHCDSPFILAKDNHFMIDMLNTNNESPKEGKHDHKLHFERKSSKITFPPKQYLSIEDTLNINKSDYKCVNPLYSAPASGFEMVFQEDFYTDLTVDKAEFPKVRVCFEDDPCHIVRDISIDEGLHFSHKILVDKEETRSIESSTSNRTLENGTSDKRVVENEQMGPIKSFISNKTINNEVDSKSVMEGSADSDDSKHTVFDRSTSNVKKGQSNPTSVLHIASDKKGSSVVTENLVDPASVIYDDYDVKESLASSVNSEDDLETTNSVVCVASAKVIENQAVPGSDFHNDCDAKASYDSQNKLSSYESVVNDAHGDGYSVSSINSEGDLNTTKNRVVLVSDDHNNFDGDNSHVSSICIVDKVDTDETVKSNIPCKVSSVSSINREGCLDTKSVVTNISAEVIENQAVPVSGVHTDCEGRESYNNSVDCQNKKDTYIWVASIVSAEVVDNQMPPSQEITADLSNANSSSQTFSNDEKQSVNAHGDGYSVSSINSEGDLNTTKNRVVSVLDDHNDFDGDGSHVSSICIVDKVDTDETVESNIPCKVSSVRSINREGCLDTKSVVTNISARVIENQAVPVSSVHNDCEGRESYNNSVDCKNKQDTYISVASIVSAEVVENQIPPSLEITADLSNANSSSQTCSNDEKQSVDGQQFQSISEETNSVCPALNFPSEVPAFSNGSKESSKIKVPSGVITFCFDTEDASISGRDENIETTNYQKSEVSQNSLGIEEATIDDRSASIRCSSLRFIQEESNLHGPALLSGHIGNSGSILYSGSASLRSESSTTSTRSFAFPM